MKTPTLLLAALLLTAACTADEPAASEPTADSQTPIAFAAYTTLTRSGLPITSYTSLQTEGFGVFAYYTRTADYNSSTSPDFMYRQQVTWDGTAWAYSPVKYWPNDNTPADNSGAQGSLAASKLSFFAYAPYEGAGISGFTASSTTGDPKVSYETPDYPNWGADLVWGTGADGCPLKNKKRVDDSGNIADNPVKFYFHHALTRLGFEVQANYDTGSDDDHRKILIESISVSSNALRTSGDLNLNSSDTPSLVPDGSVATPTVTVTIKYHVITLDADLPYGYSDQTTETTAAAALNGLAAGKQYTILLRLGLTSVKAEVTATSWNDSATNTDVNIP